MIFNKKKITSARKTQIQQLHSLLSEAKSIAYLAEGKSKSNIKIVYLNEVKRIIHNYSSLFLLEFMERGVAEAGEALHVIMDKNMDNEIGHYLSSLEVMKKVKSSSKKRGKSMVSVFERLAEIDRQKAMTTHLDIDKERFAARSGRAYQKRGAGLPITATGGLSEDLEQKITEGLFDFLRGKKNEEEFTAAATDKTPGILVEKEKLVNLVIRDMPKLVKFIVSYHRFFFEENFGSEERMERMTKRGFFGGSPLKKLVKLEFGKVPGFDVVKFSEELVSDPYIIPKNINLNEDYGEILLDIEDTIEEMKSRLERGAFSSAIDFLGGFGVGALGPAPLREELD